jgi:Ca2+-binding EF-hand superfamily protein
MPDIFQSEHEDWRQLMISEINSSYTYASYTQQSQSTQNKQMPPDLFQALDEDSSGGVDQTELDTWATNMSTATGNTIDTSTAISTYDTDEDGALSTTELKSFLDASGIKGPNGGPPPGPPPSEESTASTTNSSQTADSLISSYDTNGDGVLSSSELQTYLDDIGQTSSDSDLSTVTQAISSYLANMGKSAGEYASSRYSTNLDLSIDIAA